MLANYKSKLQIFATCNFLGTNKSVTNKTKNTFLIHERNLISNKQNKQQVCLCAHVLFFYKQPQFDLSPGAVKHF